jgi:hypothetical protein
MGSALLSWQFPYASLICHGWCMCHPFISVAIFHTPALKTLAPRCPFSKFERIPPSRDNIQERVLSKYSIWQRSASLSHMINDRLIDRPWVNVSPNNGDPCRTKAIAGALQIIQHIQQMFSFEATNIQVSYIDDFIGPLPSTFRHCNNWAVAVPNSKCLPPTFPNKYVHSTQLPTYVCIQSKFSTECMHATHFS